MTGRTHALHVADAPATRGGLRAVLAALKLRIGAEITLTALAGVAITPGHGLELWRLAALACAVLLASSAAGAFNQYAERDIDARMHRTRHRPFVTGALHADRRWLVAMGAMLVVAAVLALVATNVIAAAFVVAGSLTYGVVYTLWLKRTTWLNIVFGGFAGSFAVLAGGAAVNPQISAEPALLALALFFWTPPHFWSLALYSRDDYLRTGIPMLPALVDSKRSARIICAHVIAVVLLSVLPAALDAGPVYLLCAAVGGAYFTWFAVRLVRTPTRTAAWSCFKASLVQLSLLLVGAIADGAWRGQLLFVS
ncbi:MAG TPA: heme o synthase [Longimicrobiales bacterium]|nr:heme o synthase [Longimicrobiales bacterium]